MTTKTILLTTCILIIFIHSTLYVSGIPVSGQVYSALSIQGRFPRLPPAAKDGYADYQSEEVS